MSTRDQFLTRNLEKPLSGAAAFLLLFGLSMGAMAHAETQQADDTYSNIKQLKICISGKPFLVPWLPELSIQDLNNVSHGMSEHSIKRDKDPLDANEVIHAISVRFVKYRSRHALLSPILGRDSDYEIGSFFFGRPWGEEEWAKKMDVPSKTRPRRIGDPKLLEDFSPPNLTMFNESVAIGCLLWAQPPYTEDSPIYCHIDARTHENTYVSIGLHKSGRSLPDWPSPEGSWEQKDWSIWKNPLTEIEESWRKMRAGGGTFKCS